MEDLHKPFSRRPRKQSLSAIIERIVLEKQRQKEKIIFDQLECPNDDGAAQEAVGVEKCDDPSRDQSNANALSQQAPETPRAPAPTAPLPAVQEEDEELEEDEETEEKEDAMIDPERLKAFNMFVRLFADENLDRMIPISKQPKERIQAIMDSCGRQFPEFGDRARKRLRTYLKACRRNKRSRELAGVDGGAAGRPSRPTPPHLTSAQAEQILAQACQNESRNAKRMHLGLEPVGAFATSQAPATTASAERSQQESQSRPATQEPAAPTAEPPAPVTGALYQPNVAHVLRQLLPGLSGAPQPPAGGVPGELFFRRAPQPQLSPAEAAAVRQLAAGYRESASFLRRSADELEVLVQQSGL